MIKQPATAMGSKMAINCERTIAKWEYVPVTPYTVPPVDIVTV
jgi:hypothetical protein